MEKYSLGFDIGGTKCAAILGRGEIPSESHNGFIIDKTTFPTNVGRGWRAILDELFSEAEKLLYKHSVLSEQLVGIGISCGGPLNSRMGLIMSPPNLPGWDNVPISQITENRFGVRAVLMNDANACAVAEWKFGAGRGSDSMVFLTFGTGMGAGIILNGRVVNGASDTAGEVGHIRLAEDGPLGYGKRGSFEGFCSGGGIANLARDKAKAALASGIEPMFCKNEAELLSVSAKTVAEAAVAGDETAKEVYDICGEYLGRGLSLIIDILNPERIVIGSIYQRSCELLQKKMYEAIEKETLAETRGACKILAAELGDSIGDYAALSAAIIG